MIKLDWLRYWGYVAISDARGPRPPAPKSGAVPSRKIVSAFSSQFEGDVRYGDVWCGMKVYDDSAIFVPREQYATVGAAPDRKLIKGWIALTMMLASSYPAMSPL